METPPAPQPDSGPDAGSAPGTSAAADTSSQAASATTSTGAADTPIYPLSLRLAGRRVLVAGGGPVALRRVAGLRAADAQVVVVAPRLTPALADLAARGL